MKRSMRCPKCQYRQLWVVPLVDLASHREVEIDDPSASPKVITLETVPVREFEAYVCAQCGYTETWAISLEEVAKVGTLTSDVADGPFRSLYEPRARD